MSETSMFDLLASLYPWVKAMHIMSVITWMAGIFYLPRIFVYHVEGLEKAGVQTGGETDRLFQVMEQKLYRLIMNPSMISTWVFGLMLVLTPGIVDWSTIWPWTKAIGIIGMTWFHHWLGLRRKEFVAGANTRTGRQYRMMNELPTLLMILVVLSVVLKF